MTKCEILALASKILWEQASGVMENLQDDRYGDEERPGLEEYAFLSMSARRSVDKVLGVLADDGEEILSTGPVTPPFTLSFGRGEFERIPTPVLEMAILDALSRAGDNSWEMKYALILRDVERLLSPMLKETDFDSINSPSTREAYFDNNLRWARHDMVKNWGWLTDNVAAGRKGYWKASPRGVVVYEAHKESFRAFIASYL